MDDDDIYICFPGEVVVYQPSDLADQNAGLLCTVQGIRKGKVEALVHGTSSTILVAPSELIESGDYGSDMYELKDEVNQIYEGFDESADMDTGGQSGEYEENFVSDAPPGNEMETAMYYFLSGNCAPAYEVLSSMSGGSAIDWKRDLYSGRCLHGQGDYEQALHHYMRAFNTSGGAEGGTMCHIAISHHSLGNDREAWNWCQRALQASPHSPSARYLAARLLDLNDGNAEECADQLKTCIIHCPVVDSEQPLSEAVEMWCDIAHMAQSLALEAPLCLRAWLRAIGVARSVGALNPATCVPFSPVRAVELDRIRPVACKAMLELGNGLLSSAESRLIAAANPTDVWHSVSKAQNSSGSKKKKQGGSSGSGGAEKVSSPPVGWGYVNGAVAAHTWCNQISGGSKPEYKRALLTSQTLLASLSK